MDLLKLALESAVATGEILMDRPAAFEISTKSSAIDIATQMDEAAERLIVERIRSNRPGDAIVGEEGAQVSGSSGIRWVIDPLDGTVNYLYGLPGWCVSIAAKDREGTVVGVVHAPSLGMTWQAVRGSGAFLNGKRISTSEVSQLDKALIATGFSYSREVRQGQSEAIKKLIPLCRDVRRLGAAAVDLCHVASGGVDGYFEVGLKEWDLAAGALIATEAGALVTGGESDEVMVIAANSKLHQTLRDFLEAVGQ
ncbi:MAG: inositol monophosphatase [Actinobacteria bacterium]|nr:inositol monophosphatase [Actinomycetota bacterium]